MMDELLIEGELFHGLDQEELADLRDEWLVCHPCLVEEEGGDDPEEGLEEDGESDESEGLGTAAADPPDDAPDDAYWSPEAALPFCHRDEDGYVTCSKPPWKEFGRIGRITTFVRPGQDKEDEELLGAQAT